MKILFLIVSGVRLDVRTPEREPLGGSESCVAYLAAALASSHEVMLLANTRPRTINGVRHVKLDFDLADARAAKAFFRSLPCDIIVVLNAPSVIPWLRQACPHARLVLWNHHAPDQSSVRPLGRIEVCAAVDFVVYLSDWQRTITESIYRSPVPSGVIGDGLTPSFENLFTSSADLLATKELRAAYTSTPFRGLDVLLAAHAQLNHPLELDIFSSMQVYRGDDAPFQWLYETARISPRVHYHGSVSQVKLAEAMRRVSFLAYPSTFAETFCIAALEAMAAGATVVTTDLGALPSTTMGYGDLLPLDDGLPPERLVAAYAQLLDTSVARARQNREQWAEKMFEQLKVVNRECTWRRREVDWQTLFSELMKSPPRS